MNIKVKEQSHRKISIKGERDLDTLLFFEHQTLIASLNCDKTGEGGGIKSVYSLFYPIH